MFNPPTDEELHTRKVSSETAPPPAVQTKKHPTLAQREGRAGYALIGPTTVLLTIFHIWPILQTAGYSFTNWNSASGKAEFVGLKNFVTLMNSTEFLRSAGNTLLYVIVVVPLTIGIGLFLAALLVKPFRGRGVYRAMIFIPYIAPVVGTSLIFSYILSPLGGLANQALRAIGLAPIGFLNSEPWALISVMIFSIWQGVGYTMIICLAALTNIPPTYHEAAALDGAGPIRRFFSISVPLVAPTLAFLSVTGVIMALQVFTQIYVLTQGGPLHSTQTILYYIYRQGFIHFNGGMASAAAMVLLVVGALFAIIQLRVLRRPDTIELT